MIGRYGTDGLNQFLSMSSIVMLLVSLLTRVSLFTWLGAALLILSLIHIWLWTSGGICS